MKERVGGCVLGDGEGHLFSNVPHEIFVKILKIKPNKFTCNLKSKQASNLLRDTSCPFEKVSKAAIMTNRSQNWHKEQLKTHPAAAMSEE